MKNNALYESTVWDMAKRKYERRVPMHISSHEAHLTFSFLRNMAMLHNGTSLEQLIEQPQWRRVSSHPADKHHVDIRHMQKSFAEVFPDALAQAPALHPLFAPKIRFKFRGPVAGQLAYTVVDSVLRADIHKTS